MGFVRRGYRGALTLQTSVSLLPQLHFKTLYDKRTVQPSALQLVSTSTHKHLSFIARLNLGNQKQSATFEPTSVNITK